MSTNMGDFHCLFLEIIELGLGSACPIVQPLQKKKKKIQNTKYKILRSAYDMSLAELLTGEKAIFSTKTQESKSLATYFIQSVDENNLFDIINS
jgi:hypothetical protein